MVSKTISGIFYGLIWIGIAGLLSKFYNLDPDLITVAHTFIPHTPISDNVISISLFLGIISLSLIILIIKLLFPKITFDSLFKYWWITVLSLLLSTGYLLGTLYLIESFNQSTSVLEEKSVPAEITKVDFKLTGGRMDIHKRYYAIIRLESHPADAYYKKSFEINAAAYKVKDSIAEIDDKSLMSQLNKGDKLIVKIRKGKLGEDFATEMYVKKDKITVYL